MAGAVSEPLEDAGRTGRHPLPFALVFSIDHTGSTSSWSSLASGSCPRFSLMNEDQSWIDGVANHSVEKKHSLPDEDHGRVCARRYAPNFVRVAPPFGRLLKQSSAR